MYIYDFNLSGGKYKTSSSGYQNVGKHIRVLIHRNNPCKMAKRAE